MIGVIANPSDRVVVNEFFELFKTPWEWYREGRRYEVVLCAGDNRYNGRAKLTLHYAGTKGSFNEEGVISTRCREGAAPFLSYNGNRIPIYGDMVTFPEKEIGLLTHADSSESAAYREQSGQSLVVRIGYDLFSEIQTLLTQGQPSSNAHIPALELHIAFLRDLITGSGIPLVEIPPVPAGFPFIACLTHDVDHPSIRQHKWDHTAFGFLYRALFGSSRQLVLGRMPFRDVLKNWAAALKLPFVYAGVAEDFWRGFDDRYLALEKGLRSTFFLIPFKDSPGKNLQGSAEFRASRYGAAAISDTIRKLTNARCEIGLHGIDAWCDSVQGSAELEEIRRLAEQAKIGVRTHWLYYDQQSPVVLEQAGAAYDSTIGYNETVGYRAGTMQLLELPLHVMDTALFYPAYLGLAPKQATTILSRMIDNAIQFGGCLTVNWHDRSLAPERLWYAPYRDFLHDLKNRKAWFATAGEAISWFRKRRSVVFETASEAHGGVRARVTAAHDECLPSLQLRIHNGQQSRDISGEASESYFDLVFEEAVYADGPGFDPSTRVNSVKHDGNSVLVVKPQ